MKKLLATIILMGAALAQAEPWSDWKIVKKIEFDQAEGYRKITAIVDDGASGTEEAYEYRFDCAGSVGYCYQNTGHHSKVALSMLQMAMTTRMKVRFYFEQGTGIRHYRVFEVSRD